MSHLLMPAFALVLRDQEPTEDKPTKALVIVQWSIARCHIRPVNIVMG